MRLLKERQSGLKIQKTKKKEKSSIPGTRQSTSLAISKSLLVLIK